MKDDEMVKLNISAPDANLAAADMTSSFHAFEARTYNLIMNHQPGMMYWNGEGDSQDEVDDGRVNFQGENVVMQFVEIFRVMKMNDCVDPISGNYYHVSDIINPRTLPEKSWFNKIFGSTRNDGRNGVSYFGGHKARWSIVDMNYMANYKENYISGIYGDNQGDKIYRIRAMYNNETRISLIFYDYELYKTMHERIYQ